MVKKESVFISAVLYLSDYTKDVEKFTKNLLDGLRDYFQHYEVIIVNDCTVKHENFLEEVLPSLGDSTITVVHMSVKQGIEACLRAGLDVSIGDFVFEFDTLEFIFEKKLLWDVYQEALKGNDVVSVETKNNSFSRKMFYNLFNKYSNANYEINASVFRLVSRRAINRVLELNMSSSFRQAVYASCGLKNSKVEYEGSASSKKARDFNLAIDSFLLYTDLGKKVSNIAILLNGLLLIAGIVSSFIVQLGWLYKLTITFSITLAVIYLILTLNYLRLSLRSKDNKYLISNIEKIQKR